MLRRPVRSELNPLPGPTDCLVVAEEHAGEFGREQVGVGLADAVSGRGPDEVAEGVVHIDEPVALVLDPKEHVGKGLEETECDLPGEEGIDKPGEIPAVIPCCRRELFGRSGHGRGWACKGDRGKRWKGKANLTGFDKRSRETGLADSAVCLIDCRPDPPWGEGQTSTHDDAREFSKHSEN